MALVADLDAIDLVVEPHEMTAEDLAAFREAVEVFRQRPETSRLTQEALELLGWASPGGRPNPQRQENR